MATHSCAASCDCTEALDVNADLSVLDALSSMYQWQTCPQPFSPDSPLVYLIHCSIFTLCSEFYVLGTWRAVSGGKSATAQAWGPEFNLQYQQEKLSTAGCACHHNPDPWGLLASWSNQIGEFQVQQETVSKLRWKPSMVVYTFNCSRGRGLNRGGSEFKAQ